MGTNYYIPTDACPTCGHGGEGLHVGKSSAGWRFIFAPARHLGIESWKAWRAYLSKPENRDRIADEYGKPVTLAELVSCVENRPPDARSSSHDLLDSEGYCFSRSWDFS